MALVIPLCASLFEPFRRDAQTINAQFFIANYTGVLVGFGIGLFYHYLKTRIKRSWAGLAALAGAMLLVLPVGIFALVWFEGRLGADAHGLTTIAGMVLGDLWGTEWSNTK